MLCEYDALPDIGHACGHNIIATAGLGAGWLQLWLKNGGSLRILGTPAEEGGGGKVLGDRGAFDKVDAALMITQAFDLGMNTIAIHRLQVEYEGQAAHAAASPHGKNALDAAVLGYQNIAALRQHIRPDERIHGILLMVEESQILFLSILRWNGMFVQKHEDFGTFKETGS